MNGTDRIATMVEVVGASASASPLASHFHTVLGTTWGIKALVDLINTIG